MSRKFARMVVTLVIVSVLVSALPIAALAAPPGGGHAPAPAPAPAPGVYHVVKCGENLTRIALKYGTTVWAIAQANGIRNVNCIRSGQVLVIPGPEHHEDHHEDHGHGKFYIVQPGDTLSGIAWRFGVSLCALAKANGIWDYNHIFMYQKLYIP